MKQLTAYQTVQFYGFANIKEVADYGNIMPCRLRGYYTRNRWLFNAILEKAIRERGLIK